MKKRTTSPGNSRPNTRRRPPRKMKRKASAVRARAKGPRTPEETEQMQLRRIVLVGGVLFTFMGAVLASCLYLQGCESEAFVDEAERNYLRMLRLDTQRGDIYDRSGEALATSVEVETVYANPREVVDPIATADVLAPILDIDQERLIRQLTGEGHFRYLRRQVTGTIAQRVRTEALPGVHILREAKRFYPKKELAGQLLGVVGVDSRGREGLEATFDRTLRGGKLQARYHRDAKGRYAMLEALPPVDSRSGHQLQVTIDEKIQAVAEQELERAVLSSMGRSGVCIVMDVPTGDLLAVAHYPRFNPNRYREQIADDHAALKRGLRVVPRYRNRAISDQYEPGSTFKIFTLAAGLDARLVGLDDVINTEGGRYRVGRKTISDTHPMKKQTVRQIIKYSSNIGVIKIAEMLGEERLWSALDRFGFGQPSGVALLGDAAGKLRPPKEWAVITRANIAFGQGVAVTPLQIVAAAAAIGNDGVLMQPRIVMAELDSDRRVVREYPPQPIRRVISADTARLVRRAMAGVVEHDGTGHEAWIYDYDVAGKTGTAQKPDPLAGGYSQDRWIASFLGLVPVEKPRLAILVAVDEPKGQYYGGVVAAPAFRAVAEWTLNHLGVAPSYGRRERIRPKPIRAWGSPDPAAEGAYYDVPDGVQPGVDPAMPRSVTVPDFTDLPIREAVELAHKSYLSVQVDGSGVAAGQSIQTGRFVGPWTKLTIYFRPDQAERPASGEAAP